MPSGPTSGGRRPLCLAAPRVPGADWVILGNVDQLWRLLHLVAAAYWLGGLMLLAVVAVVANRTLDRAAFRTFMARAGRAFLYGSLAAWVVLALSGLAMAAPRLRGFDQLGSTGWGRTLAAKTGLALLAVALTAGHALTGARPDSAASIRASRLLSPMIFLVTLAIFYLAVRLTEG